MKKFASIGLALCLFSGALQAGDKEEPLFTFEGKTYTTKDLTPGLQQASYDIAHQAHGNLQRVVDAQILEDYVNREAKKKGIPVDKFREDAFKGKQLGDKEVKAWFEANKARLGGRDLSALKGDILNLLQSQENDKVKTTVLTKLKKDGKFNFLPKEPEAPTLVINTQGYPSKGDPKAKVTIVEFADYKCPHCRDASHALKKVYEKYKNKVHFVYLDFPIDRSGISKKVSEGAVCADQQKKFWDYHYMAYDESNLTIDSPKALATKLKLDMKAFETCLASPETTRKVDAAKNEGERLGIDGTPSIYFNGRKVYGNNEQLLEEALKKIL
jgi:protein-disulfide isomerase